jgi:toxin FitB
MDCSADTSALYLSAMSIAEVQRGIELTRDQDVSKALEIEAWLEEVVNTGQVLDIDASVGREWAKLMHRRSNTLVEEAFIAATARVHQLTVVTRNTSDFKALKVATHNPFVK